MIDLDTDYIDKLSVFDHGREVMAVANNGDQLEGTLLIDDYFWDGEEDCPVFVFYGHKNIKLNLTDIQSIYFDINA